MKPQQLCAQIASVGEAARAPARCARSSLPTLAAIAVAIASSVVLTFAGCASSAGIVPTAQANLPNGIGRDAALPTDWRSTPTLTDLVPPSDPGEAGRGATGDAGGAH